VIADPLELAAALADALEAPVPDVGTPARLWLLGTGSHHDAAELVTHLFTGSGRSCRAVGSDGHAQLPGLIGPADAVVLVGPPEDGFLAFGRRLAGGAGALVVEVRPGAGTDSTITHLTAAARLLRLALAAGAPGATADDLDRLPGAVAALAADPDLPLLPMPERALLLAGAGPAAVTARHGAVVLRASGLPAEGVEAADLLGGLLTDLGPKDTVLALDPARDLQSPTATLVRSAATTGARVVVLDGPPDLSPVCAQFPLAARLRLLADAVP
jgi:hypothetical protein